MDTSKMQPITWNAADYQIGDQFAVMPQFRKVYTITERQGRGDLIEFKATSWSEADQEEWDGFTFTFPADFPLSARRRIRTIVAPCMLCGTPGKNELDTAYVTSNVGVCGKH